MKIWSPSKSATGKSATVALLSCKPYILGPTFVIKYIYGRTFCGQFCYKCDLYIFIHLQVKYNILKFFEYFIENKLFSYI